MKEEFGYEVTPEQSLDGLWKTMHKYIHHHGMSDISLEMEGSQYEFRHHLKKYEEYKEKAEAWDEFVEYFDSVVSEEGYVGDSDKNIVVNIQNIRMNHQFESEE